MTDAEFVLKKLLKKTLKEHNYVDPDVEIKPITSGGANITSALFNVKVIESGREALNLFAKVANVGDKVRDQMNADWMFKTEQYVYTKLVPMFNKMQCMNGNATQFVFPKFYGSVSKVGEESVVLENLIAKGYNLFDRFKSLDCEQVRSCMETLANYHALSFVYEKLNPVEYHKTLQALRFNEKEQNEDGKELFGRMVASALSVLDEEQRTRLMDLIKVAALKYVYYNKPLKKPVLIHGDFRPSNLLYRKKNGKLELIAVDYQTVHAGCLAMDIIYFMTVATDHHYRRFHFEDTLNHYYRHLADTLQGFHIDIDQVYPKHVFDEEIKEMLPFSIIIGFTLLPLVCADEDNAPQMSGEADLNVLAIKPNRLYAERFRGVVADCIRWGAV